MKVRIQMIFEAEDGKPEVIEEVGQLQRGPLRPSELGLSLAEAKSLLHGMQQALVAEQVDEYLGQFKTCAFAVRRVHGRGNTLSSTALCLASSISTVPDSMTVPARTTVGVVRVH